MKLLTAFLLSWRDLSQISTVYQHAGILIGKENASVKASVKARRKLKLAFEKEDVMSKQLYIPLTENENHWILVIAFPKSKFVASYDPLKTDFKKKASEIILTFLTSSCEGRNQSISFQSWKFDILDGRRQLHTTDYGIFFLAMAMEIDTKQIIFDSLSTIDLLTFTGLRLIASAIIFQELYRNELKLR